MTRFVQYTESLGLTTGVSGSKVRLTFTGNEGDVYLVFANCSAGDDLGDKFYVACQNPADEFFFDQSIEPFAAGDFYSCPMHFFVTLGAGANNFDVLLNFVRDAGTNIVSIREASILALKLDPLDSIPANNTGASTSSTTYATIKSHTFTVDADGDYLVLVNAGDNFNGTTGADSSLRFTVDGTVYSETIFRSSTTVFPYGTPYLGIVKVTLTAGSHTIVLQGKVTAGTLSVSYAAIIALRLDTFVNNYYAEARASTNVTTVDPTFTSKVTLAPTTSAAPHIVFSSSMASQTVAARVIEQRTQLDSTDAQFNLIAEIVAGSQYAHSSLKHSVLTAAAHTIALQAAKDVGGPGTGVVQIHSAAIALLELPDPPVVNILGGSILGANIL